MPDSGLRVALLARKGEVREQLRNALVEAGADVVAEGDPAELDPGTVAGKQPGVVVVSLEPSIEDALAEFDDLLAMPGVQVIYDDAEVTGQLDGWDLARWARHLAAKLAGSAVVLPPAPAGSENVPDAVDDTPLITPGAPKTPAQEMDHHKLEDYAAESLDLSEWVPTTPSLTDVAVEPAEAAAPAEEPGLDMDLALDIDLASLEQAMATPLPVAEAAADEPALELADDPALAGFAAAATGDDDAAPDLGEFLDLSVADSFRTDDLDAGPAPAAGDEPLLVDFEIPDGPVSFSSFADDDVAPLGVDDDVAALAAQLEAFEEQSRPEPRDPDFARAVEDKPLSFDEPLSLDEPTRAPAAATRAAPAAADAGFGSLELAPMEGDAPTAASRPPPPKDEPVKIDFGGLSLVDDSEPAFAAPSSVTKAPAAAERPSTLSLADDGPPPMFAPREAAPARGAAPARASTLSLQGDAPAAAPVAARRGALFVLAGLGGPDGVRQLLASLPAGLPVPVLLYQHLDTGKHDRLVGQLAKASRLPVELAVPGQHAAMGRVAVLPPGIGVQLQDDTFAFVSGATLPSIVDALPASDSAVLVLSGGDPAVVPAVQAMQAAGGHVYAQDPASCFDAGAPQALIAGGATTAPVPELARRITECWS